MIQFSSLLCFFNPHKNGLFVAPMHNGLKYGVSLQCLLSSWSKNFKLRTLTKYQSLNSLLTVNKCFIQLLLFGFTFLDLLIKFMKMRLLYILYCPPTPATWRQGHFYTFAILYRLICSSPPHPAFLLAGAAAHYESRFWPPEGEGGDRYNISTCRMAEGSKDPCISHVDASHGEWQRIESSLLFCIFFYIVKIIEKSLFYELEIGFIGKITY